ncbi:hypothetical protein ABFV99_14070 [Cytobacillus horneckiae]|uniref:hypothetical protein n=1 Tax=Cytobacillus horneckiae TaxID=549687 RepID=UPI0034CDF583
MSAFYPRNTNFESKLFSKKIVSLSIQGIYTSIEYSHHSIKRSKHRGVFDSAIVHMIQEGFDEILDLQNHQRFILINKELGLSIIGSLHCDGLDVVIDIISVIDSTKPTNPYNTFTIAI